MTSSSLISDAAPILDLDEFVELQTEEVQEFGGRQADRADRLGV
jgi:hypothetical protein